MEANCTVPLHSFFRCQEYIRQFEIALRFTIPCIRAQGFFRPPLILAYSCEACLRLASISVSAPSPLLLLTVFIPRFSKLGSCVARSLQSLVKKITILLNHVWGWMYVSYMLFNKIYRRIFLIKMHDGFKMSHIRLHFPSTSSLLVKWPPWTF